ncbi:MAG: ABC transporter permease subunit [Chlorobi bacterium]|nr:ABC transporter permease subunit [Chlorobiota bacterium]
MKDILALPISRSSIVISKFLVVFLWCSLLTIILYAVGIFMGQMIVLADWSEQIFTQLSIKFFTTAFLTLFLCTPVAFFASYGRGFIAPIGFVIITLVIAQFIALLGLGPYFPWAIPGVFTAPAGTEGLHLFTSSYIILILTSISGLIGTILWWRLADQHL